MNFLKHGWFFTITAIFASINLIDGEYLRVITFISFYFFIEISALLISFKMNGFKIETEVDKSDSK